LLEFADLLKARNQPFSANVLKVQNDCLFAKLVQSFAIQVIANKYDGPLDVQASLGLRLNERFNFWLFFAHFFFRAASIGFSLRMCLVALL